MKKVFEKVLEVANSISKTEINGKFYPNWFKNTADTLLSAIGSRNIACINFAKQLLLSTPNLSIKWRKK